MHRARRSWPSSSLVALLAPLIAPAEGLEVTKATGGVLEPPSGEFWLGTDDKGRSVLTLLIWGARISLFVGLAATRDLDGARHADRADVGLLRRLDRRDPVPAHRVVPGDPVPAAGHRDGHRARPVAAQHRHRHRRHLVAGHRAADPQPDPDDPRAALPRAGPGARRRLEPPDPAAHPAQRDADGLRQHHAHRGDRDPHRDHAELPRPRRPDPRVVGLDARRRVRRRRDHHRRLVVHRAAGRVRRPGRAELHPRRAGARRGAQPEAGRAGRPHASDRASAR